MTPRVGRAATRNCCSMEVTCPFWVKPQYSRLFIAFDPICPVSRLTYPQHCGATFPLAQSKNAAFSVKVADPSVAAVAT